MKKNKGSILLLITAFIWGSAFVAQSVGNDIIKPYTFNCLRSVIGAISLIPVLLFQAGDTVIQMLQVKVGMFIPAVAVFFGLLARRAIRKDEKLVKSMDRLR